MTKLPLGSMPWLPDRAAVDNTGLTALRNAIPYADHYGPVLGPERTAQQTIPGTSWRGFTLAKSPDGATAMIVAGDDKLYRVEGKSSPPVDVSRDLGTYLMEPTDTWRFVSYNSLLIGTNFRDLIQAYDLSTSGPTFDDLQPGGTGVTAAPRARYIAVVYNILCVASTWDDWDGEVGNRVRWAGIVDGLPTPTSWDILPQTQADFQDLKNVGNITGYTGGQFGTLLCERGIVIQQFSSSTLFSFQTVASNVGCEVPNSVIQLGNTTYFLSQDGWYAVAGGQPVPIGDGQIDDWFLADFDLGQQAAMTATVNTEKSLLVWAYPGQGNTGRANRLLFYSPSLQRWGVAFIEVDWLGQSQEYGLDLNVLEDFPDLNTDSRNLNDPRLWLVTTRMGAIIDGGVNGFVGEPLEGTFDGPEIEFAKGMRAVIQRIIPNHEGGDMTVQIGIREAANRPATFSAPHAPQPDGTIRCRETGRFFRPRVVMANNWAKMTSIEVQGQQLGQR